MRIKKAIRIMRDGFGNQKVQLFQPFWLGIAAVPKRSSLIVTGINNFSIYIYAHAIRRIFNSIEAVAAAYQR
jgi:hypothetical protein